MLDDTAAPNKPALTNKYHTTFKIPSFGLRI